MASRTVVSTALLSLILSACNGFSGPQQEAWAACQGYVAKWLKAPGSAQYPDQLAVAKRVTANRYRFSGYVDSQNGFGALLRADFSCGVSRSSANSEWTGYAIVTRN